MNHLYHDKNFEILSVSLDDDRTSWTKAIKSDQYVWTNISDLLLWDSPVAKLYAVESIPANFLIDPTGKIVAKNLRGISLLQKLRIKLGK
ncbi:MAG: peroxiredoxin family protein [Flavobacterium sp.]|uniref:peroxiredoxin family protein n=1 Tax=Flavobacterium sp. TaxID=239 RepID=UPI003BBD8F17